MAYKPTMMMKVTVGLVWNVFKIFGCVLTQIPKQPISCQELRAFRYLDAQVYTNYASEMTVPTYSYMQSI